MLRFSSPFRTWHMIHRQFKGDKIIFRKILSIFCYFTGRCTWTNQKYFVTSVYHFMSMLLWRYEQAVAFLIAHRFYLKVTFNLTYLLHYKIIAMLTMFWMLIRSCVKNEPQQEQHQAYLNKTCSSFAQTENVVS